MSLVVNGRSESVEVAPGEVLLDLLRRLGLTGTKDGCRRGECGACTVLVDGRAVLSCLTLARSVAGPVETVEGVAEEARTFRQALADRGGFQCAYCTSGIVVRAVSLLRDGLAASDEGLKRQMAGNLCRCTGYAGIIEALRLAEGRRRAERP